MARPKKGELNRAEMVRGVLKRLLSSGVEFVRFSLPDTRAQYLQKTALVEAVQLGIRVWTRRVNDRVVEVHLGDRPAPTRRKTPARKYAHCECGRPAYKVRADGPVCRRCFEIEQMLFNDRHESFRIHTGLCGVADGAGDEAAAADVSCCR